MITAYSSTEALNVDDFISRSHQPTKTSFESTDTAGSSPAQIATPELQEMDQDFGTLEDNTHTSTLKGSMPPPDMPVSHYTHTPSPRRSLSNGKKRDMIKSGSWRQKATSFIGSSSNESSGNSADSCDSPTESSSHDTVVPHPTVSTTTGCYISAPMSPPIGYPMPQVGLPAMPRETQHQVHADPRASISSSTSSGSSGEKPGSTKSLGPPAPRWAQPPGATAAASMRATSFDSGLDRSDVQKHNPETTIDPSGEWVEVLKGEQGRIAIKSTPTQHEVMVWLPGFRLDDITIVSRRHQVLHIVADQWDESDHAQWEIKLGDDALMTSIRASFTGQELTITVQRNPHFVPSNKSVRSNVSMRTASSRMPSITGTIGHTQHERSFSSPSMMWGEQERSELEARMTRGTAAMGLI